MNPDDLDFVATPRSTARFLARIAGLQSHHVVLEPSAGEGHLADLLAPECDEVVCIEIDEQRAQKLREKGYETYQDDFLEFAQRSVRRFDRVVMAPPFGTDGYTDHIRAACSCCKTGGVVVSVIPDRWPQHQTSKEHEFWEWVGSSFEVATRMAMPDEPFPTEQVTVETDILIINV